MLTTGYYSSFQNIEQIIKHFYDRFKVERTTFQNHFQLQDSSLSRQEQEQLASLLLNRLMFIYFLQTRGFLDGDRHYLNHHLQRTCHEIGRDMFYCSFLPLLFQKGLGMPTHPPHIVARLGKVPYLGSNLFTLREFEYREPALLIPDAAFKRLFTFFDHYHWHLDEPLSREKGSITPDILGYIFEQYVNQQQMGAYYTREDTTAYIANNTIIPYFFDVLAQKIPTTFADESPIWQLLQNTPERYIPEVIASPHYLPDETPREYLQRRNRYTTIRECLSTGQVKQIDDFISYNLHITCFARDVIYSFSDPALLLACYQQLTSITILDPTCGSGAFLLAALRTLFPLYEACLEQLQKHDAMNTLLPRLSQWPYSILKTIITNNLYGIDIMEEATEICKLHLFLKLLAQVETIEDIEPLPDIDHNIHTGNTLIEYIQQPQDIYPTSSHLEAPSLQEHWQQAFTDILAGGGFAVIIGNPPYVEYTEQTFPYSLNHFHTRVCANLYTCIVERSQQLLSPQGRHGMILPLAAFATKNMQPFLEIFRNWFPVSWISFYHFRPSMLFSGGKVASIPTAIYLTKSHGQEQRFSTHLIKWAQEQRPLLFARLSYHQISAPRDPLNRHYYPKISQQCENLILSKVLQHQPISAYLSRIPNHNTMYYRTAGGLYWKVFVNFPWPYHTTSNKQCFFREGYERDVFVALYNSSLFWWYYTITFDSFNLKDYMLFGFRFTYPDNPSIVQQLQHYSQQLMEDYCRYAKHLKRGQTGSYTIYARKSKTIIDAIDTILAQHYGFTPEELDFILNYDIKYRMGLLPNTDLL
ncbi:Eco57I restriction-modification methylase domain-containing protein [Dictyobacter arantiisoli]|uniref:site-specific DNA-methyltransferase (adenine-specific) n=1 Tax=Dictyobacter arantiisoli TaxID=2014874 RepID=A0A5A5T8A6_9CHLR|nr:DNA methyltransferase [Dictyobacter arantiisoli]GCF07396.1 restriction endonuclease subunit M [Dictyobacter arantiisoli]